MSSDGTTGPVILNGFPPGSNTKSPARMELQDMIKNQPEQWKLFLRALERFRDTSKIPEERPLSYFQIAGIHGKPYIKWPNEKWNTMGQSKAGFGGFCTHSSILFLPWHRAYLALFESELQEHVNDAAKELSRDERSGAYLEAAETFRIPHWDWARLGFPSQAESSPVGPGDGGEKNPLASYQFEPSTRGAPVKDPPEVEKPKDGPKVIVKNTHREEGFEERLDDLKDKSKGNNLTERFVYLLQAYKDFGAVSNNIFNKQSSFNGWGSIEDIHNSIHGQIGGQMGNPQVAAFDPIFWLHHTNIDRMFAMWQALHQDGKESSYVTKQTAQVGTFNLNPGDVEDVQTDLTPFNKSKTEFWKSGDVKSTKTFGYVYPETEVSRSKTTLQALIDLYPMGSAANMMMSTGTRLNDAMAELQRRAASLTESASAVKPLSSIKTDSAISLKDIQEQQRESNKSAQAPMGKTQQSPPGPAANAPGQSSSSGPSVDKSRHLNDLHHNNKYLEWLVNIRADKSELDGNFHVHVFLGDPDDSDPKKYAQNLSYVGVFATFGQDKDTACQNCQDGRAAGIHITGQIPLTIALIERYIGGLVGGLTPEDVVPYLQKNLHWRVTIPDDEPDLTPQRRGELRRLLFSVVTCEVTLPGAPDELPRYADVVVPRAEVTTNRNGGPRGDGTGFTGGPLV
ncbi:hypothetical protein LQW54_010977 [Pestalotiopsis sp. IQ-011]